MNIVLVNYGFPPESIGGAETYTDQMARALQKRGHEVWVICYHPLMLESEKFSVREESYVGAAVVRINFPASNETRYRVHPPLTIWARKWLQDIKADIVYTGMFWQLLGVLRAASACAIPTVIVTHAYDLFCGRGHLVNSEQQICKLQPEPKVCWHCILGNSPDKVSFLPWLAFYGRRFLWAARSLPSCRIRRFASVADVVGEQQRTRNWLCQYATAILCPSKYSYRLHRRNLPNYARLIHFPYGMDCAPFIPIRETKTKGKYVFSYIGRLDPLKGIDTAIEAVKALPQDLSVEFRIYGDAEHPWYRPYAKELQRIADGDERILFCGLAHGDSLFRAYEDMSALVLPTLTENQSLTIQEALAAHRPVLCSTAGGNTEMITDGFNGLTFPPGDITGLRNAMIRVIEEHLLLEHLTSRAAPYKDIRDSAAELEQIFEKAL